MVNGIEGGRVDKQIALAVRAEMLVMAASTLCSMVIQKWQDWIDNRGTVLFNQTYDPEKKWKIAADACKDDRSLSWRRKETVYGN